MSEKHEESLLYDPEHVTNEAKRLLQGSSLEELQAIVQTILERTNTIPTTKELPQYLLPELHRLSFLEAAGKARIVLSNDEKLGFSRHLLDDEVNLRHLSQRVCVYQNLKDTGDTPEKRDFVFFHPFFPLGYIHLFIYDSKYTHLSFQTSESDFLKRKERIISLEDLKKLKKLLRIHENFNRTFGLSENYWLREKKEHYTAYYYDSASGEIKESYHGQELRVITVKTATPISK